MRSRIQASAAVVVCTVFACCPGVGRAAVVGLDQQMVLFQSFVGDLVVGGLLHGRAIDPLFEAVYTATFTQDGWSGEMAGVHLGESMQVSMLSEVAADPQGRSEHRIDGTGTFVGGDPQDFDGRITQTESGDFEVRIHMVPSDGSSSGITWVTPSDEPLTATVEADGTIVLRGKVRSTTGGNNRRPAELRLKPDGTFTSSVRYNEIFIRNRGSYNSHLVSGTQFDGDMEMFLVQAVVPEPASGLLLFIALLALAHRRHATNTP